MNISLFKLHGTIIWNSQRIQLPKIRAHPARMQLYYLTDIRFTLDLKYCSYEYLLERSFGNHNAHKLPKSRTLSIKVFFLPKKKSSKEEMKQGCKKYLSAAKITIHILLRSRVFFELHMQRYQHCLNHLPKRTKYSYTKQFHL